MSDQNNSFNLSTFQPILVNNIIPNYTGMEPSIRNKIRSFPFNGAWIEEDEERSFEEKG